jgi:UDP-N-acetylmuramoyl-tripeptide--D-alanyl-D-alanine ligase
MRLSREFVERALGGAGVTIGADVPDVVGEVSTDTRAALEDNLFVALTGERFDAHAFLADALAKGASAAVASRVPEGVDAGRLILVDDTLAALQDIAHAHLLSLEARRVALTGSNGKTTTKELIAASLGACVGAGRVLATQGNLNNHVGLPLTALRLDADHDVAVLEMGMNHLGEIERLCEIAAPDVGLVTNVGVAHAGPLGGIDGVARAKGELFAGLGRDAIGIVNLDDARVVGQARERLRARRLTFGRDSGADVRLLNVEAHTTSGLQIDVVYDATEVTAHVPYEGAHNAQNATGALAVAAALGLDFAQAATGLEAATLVAGRLARRTAASGALVLDDTYNANPDSMRVGFVTLDDLAGDRRRVVALGEMLELGDDAAAQHEQVGRDAVQSGAQLVFACGTHADAYARGARAAGLDAEHIVTADDSAALAPLVERAVGASDAVLAKGSRGARMERVVERLLQGGEA